ncbi:MAG: Arc family DNA-binding protein [Bacteroidaceae bacterium]|nr:Arc family DNA-binding protein [Bacteroidaceae bacterium]
MKKESSNKDQAKGGTKNFVLRLDTDMMNAIEAWAADEFRSTNGQIQWILAEALKKSGRMKKKKEFKQSLQS